MSEAKDFYLAPASPLPSPAAPTGRGLAQDTFEEMDAGTGPAWKTSPRGSPLGEQQRRDSGHARRLVLAEGELGHQTSALGGRPVPHAANVSSRLLLLHFLGLYLPSKNTAMSAIEPSPER